MEFVTKITPKLKEALAVFDAHAIKIIKTKVNEYHKSKFADLADVLEAARPGLAEAGLMMRQRTYVSSEVGLVLQTALMLVDKGDEGMLVSDYPVRAGKEDPQAYGSALTYARRYQAVAILGLAPEDDDGESAMNRDPAKGTPAAGKASLSVVDTTKGTQAAAGASAEAPSSGGFKPKKFILDIEVGFNGTTSIEDVEQWLEFYDSKHLKDADEIGYLMDVYANRIGGLLDNAVTTAELKAIGTHMGANSKRVGEERLSVLRTKYEARAKSLTEKVAS